MSDEITVYLCKHGRSGVVSKGIRVDVLESGEPVSVSTDDAGRTVVDVAVLRRGQRPVREVTARVLRSVAHPPEFVWPEITLGFERTFPDRPDSTWDITFTTPDYCRYFGWGLYRWSGAPGLCCSNFDVPVALEVPGLPGGASLPLSRSDAAPKAGRKHSIQLHNDPPYPGDLYCLYGNVVLPGDEEGELVYYPLASAVFGTNCFTGGVVREIAETDGGTEYVVQAAARAESGHALGMVRVRASDNRRYLVGEWVTVYIDSAQCRSTRPGIDMVWVVADPQDETRTPSIVPLSPGPSRTPVTGRGGSIDYGALSQGAMQRARVYTGMIIDIHRDRDPVTADVYLAAFGRVDGVKIFYHCEADNDRTQADPEFMADAHSAFSPDDIVRVLHVGGRRFETEAVTGEDLKIIGFADGKARPCVEKFLLFYKSGGQTHLASFRVDQGRVTVIQHGVAESQGYSGVTKHLVTFEKELRVEEGESTEILMGVPFDITDEGWAFSGFDPVYTDVWIAKYKDDAARLSYGVFHVGDQSFKLLQKSGHPGACAGFGYSKDRAFFYAMTGAVFEDPWKYALFDFFALAPGDDFNTERSMSMRLLSSPYGMTGDGRSYYSGYYSHYDQMKEQYGDYFDQLNGKYIPHLNGQTVIRSVDGFDFLPSSAWIPPYISRSEWFAGFSLCENEAALVSQVNDFPYGSAGLIAVDGRLLTNVTTKIGKDIVVLSHHGYVDCARGVVRQKEYDVEDAPGYPFLCVYEESGETVLCKIERRYEIIERWYRNEEPGGPPTDPPSAPRMVESYLKCRDTFLAGSKLLGESTSVNHLAVDFFDKVYGGKSFLVPLIFPHGFAENAVFALKTEWEFDYERRSADGSQCPSSMTKTLITPYGDRQLSATSRPMGWTQIQTEGNEHVLQGVLIINDETSGVVDAMLWHNGDRIEADLAVALGCEVTDLLGVLYLPKASTGGSDSPGLPDDPAGNWPSGHKEFCTAYPDHPSCTYNGCRPVDFTEDLLGTLQRINDEVNAAHEYQTDAELYKKLEHWTVLGDGEPGDCEDFALTKVQALIDAGVPAGAIKLCIGKAPNGEGHAWVEVQTDRGSYSMDINFTTVQPTTALPYTDVIRQYDGAWWV